MCHWVWEILCARQAANWCSWVLSKMLSFVSNISQLIFIHNNVFYLMFAGAFVSFWNTNNVCFKSLLQYSPLLLQIASFCFSFSMLELHQYYMIVFVPSSALSSWDCWLSRLFLLSLGKSWGWRARQMSELSTLLWAQSFQFFIEILQPRVFSSYVPRHYSCLITPIFSLNCQVQVSGTARQ